MKNSALFSQTSSVRSKCFEVQANTEKFNAPLKKCEVSLKTTSFLSLEYLDNYSNYNFSFCKQDKKKS